MSLARAIFSIPILLSFQLHAQSIEVIAGTGKDGHTGDGGPAKFATLDHPESIAVDKKGNVYFSEAFNHCIRKIDKKGVIHLIAGTGKEGYNGDSILAMNAQLSNPTGIALDKKGNLYIADCYNRRIRKIDKNGIIYTVAGNGSENVIADYDNTTFKGQKSATQTPIGPPFNVTVGPDNKLYISDFAAHCIRTVDINGYMSNSRKYYMPHCVFFDHNKTMFIVRNNDIKKLIKDTFQLVAGTGKYGYYGDDSLAINATLGIPMCATIDRKGNIYIPDGVNHCVRMITHDGIIRTIVGNKLENRYQLPQEWHPLQSLAQPHGIALDNKGNLYIADTYNNRIIKIKLKKYLNQLSMIQHASVR